MCRASVAGAGGISSGWLRAPPPAAGIAVHAVATNIRKKELIDNDEPESKSTI